MGLQSSHFKGGAWAPRLEGNLNTLPTRHDEGGEQKAHPGPHPRTMAAQNPSSPPTPTLTTWGPCLPSTRQGGNYDALAGGLSSSPPEKAASQGCPKGWPEHLCSAWGIGAPGCSAKQRGGRVPRTLTPITTVSSPLNLGMNLSPRRISASLSGRNRHITLMLHSAGSAISASGREGARAGAGGPGLNATKKEAANRTAHREAASSSLYEASQQVIVNSEDGQLQQLGDRVGGQSISLEPHRLQIYLPWPLPGPALRPRPTAGDHTAGRGDEQGPSLARLRPPRLLRSQPSCISTS